MSLLSQKYMIVVTSRRSVDACCKEIHKCFLSLQKKGIFFFLFYHSSLGTMSFSYLVQDTQPARRREKSEVWTFFLSSFFAAFTFFLFQYFFSRPPIFDRCHGNFFSLVEKIFSDLFVNAPKNRMSSQVKSSCCHFQKNPFSTERKKRSGSSL